MHFCGDVWSAKDSSMLFTLIDCWQDLSRISRHQLNDNHAIQCYLQKKIVVYSVVSLFNWLCMLPKMEKRSCLSSLVLSSTLTVGRTRKFMPPPWYKEGGGGLMEPLPGVFDMLQYFETILSLVESLWSSWQDGAYFMGGGVAGRLWCPNGRHLGCLLRFYQELEIRLKPREIVVFCALHDK